MALTNEQYNQIMHVYDERRADRDALLRERMRTVYRSIPEYRHTDDELHRVAVDEVRRRIADGVPADDTFDPAPMRKLSERKRTLLVKAGFGADFLDVPYVCPDCHDTGYVDGARCHCFHQLVNDLVYTTHTRETREFTFDDFSLDYYSETIVDPRSGTDARSLAAKALQQARDFVDRFDDGFANILLYGKPGTGKTLLSNCIGSSLRAAGHTVVYLSAFALFEVMRREAFSRNMYPDTAFLRLFSTDLLIVDDLGTEFSNSMTTSQLFELLNERILQKKPTVISTNLDLAGFSELYTERLFSRVMEFYTLLPLIGEDIRLLRKMSAAPDPAAQG